MVAVRVSPFGGMVPAVDDRLLPDVNAALSQDIWLYNGNAKGLPVPKSIRTLTNPNAAKVYRIPNHLTDSIHISDSTWMEFASADTDVLRTQVVGDTFNRFYWMSPLDVPRYAPLSLIQSQAPAVTGYILGVPQPGTITAAASGGASATLKSVSYVQTFVSAYGEEGPPSNPVSLTGVKIDATVTVTLAAADPNDLGTNRNLTRKRLYRTVVAANGTATFYQVADLPISTTTYADSASDATVALNSQLASTTWTAPPSDLQGMVALSNGMVVGFRQNELWFCEPYRMHAWPAQYTLVTEYPIVGLGVSNQMLVVATSGFAYTATGNTPSSMSLTKLPGLLPCTSRGSVLSTTQGVYFCTPLGLALVSPAGVVIATKELIRKDKWGALVALSTLRAARLGDSYFAFGQAIFGVFDTGGFYTTAFQQQDFSGATRGILLDPTSREVAFNLLTSQLPVINVQTDAWSAEVYIIRDGQVLWFDIGDVTQTREPFTWRSKVYQVTTKRNFQAMKVYFDTAPLYPPSYVQLTQIPAMTANVTSGVTMSASAFVVGNEPWRAGSRVAGSYWSSAALPASLYTDLGSPTVISSYDIGCPSAPASPNLAPASWTLAGSNDGINFTTVDTRAAQPAFASGEVRTYVPATQIAYRYYRLTVTAVQSGTVVGIANYQLYKPVLGVVKLFADGRQVVQRELINSGEQWRLPSGFKADYWQVEITSAIEVYSMQMATSPTELQSV